GRPRRVLIAGYYGFGNTGDEAILAAMLADLRQRLPGLRAVVPSGEPTETSSEHGVDSVDWSNLSAIIDAAEDSDLVIVGGGALFHDYWGLDPSQLLAAGQDHLAYYLSIPLIATLLGKPSMLYALGVGPLATEAGRLHCRLAFEQTAVSTVRDEPSR